MKRVIYLSINFYQIFFTLADDEDDMKKPHFPNAVPVASLNKTGRLLTEAQSSDNNMGVLVRMRPKKITSRNTTQV